VTGERIKSQYGDFAEKEPKIADIVGDYKLADISKKQLSFPDSLSSKTVIRFNPDKTFNFEYFPHNDGMDLTDYKIINAKGKWSIEESQGRWVIPMDFDTIINSATGQKENGYFNSNGFNINKDKPPYEIYIMVGDPDSWEGVTLQRR
jgi:Transcriptional regulators